MKFDLVTVPSHTIFCIRTTVPLTKIAPFLQPSYERLEQVLKDLNVESVAGRAYTYAISPDDIDIAAALVIAEKDRETVREAIEKAQHDNPDGSADDLELVTFEEGPAARATHHGNYNTLGNSWDAFSQELDSQSVKVAAPAFEDYVDRGGENSSSAVTDLYSYLER